MPERNARPVDLLIGAIEMTPLPVDDEPRPDGIPHATHEGVLEIGDLSIKVWQLSDGRCVLDADDVHRFFGMDDAMTENRTCPECGRDVSYQVARATFDGSQFGRRPRACTYPVIVSCSKGHRAEYAPLDDVVLARMARAR